jgi:hypothetical protein
VRALYYRKTREKGENTYGDVWTVKHFGPSNPEGSYDVRLACCDGQIRIMVPDLLMAGYSIATSFYPLRPIYDHDNRLKPLFKFYGLKPEGFCPATSDQLLRSSHMKRRKREPSRCPFDKEDVEPLFSIAARLIEDGILFILRATSV